MFISQQLVKKFQKDILDWYEKHQRDLPWRKTRDPYKILVSEIMLQQTQVNRVIPKYEAWLVAFPTVKHLAKAPVSEVLKHWSGLGYNRRALNLKRTAEIVSEKYDGKFPENEKELLDLPGIGTYTARAVLCFAFQKQIAVVDINVKKVILTQLIQNNTGLRLGDALFAEKQPLTDKEIAAIADQLVPHGKAFEWNQALMDYSSLMLKKERIDIPKQSTFKGSRRYYRGQILKQLLGKEMIAIKDLGRLIKADYIESESDWLNGLINEMESEGFISNEKNAIKLKG